MPSVASVITVSYAGNGGQNPLGPYSYTNVGNSAIQIGQTLANSTANVSLPSNTTLNFANTSIQSIFLVGNQAWTLKTNNATVPSSSNQVLSLAACAPLSWAANQGQNVCPFTGNITALFGYNVSGNDCVVQGQIVIA